MDYFCPETINKAQKILNNGDLSAVPLYYSPRAKNLSEWSGNALVDLSKLGLDFIKIKKNEVNVGSMTSLETLAKSQEIKSRWGVVLSEAAALSACLSMRNLASIGGVLCATEGPAEVLLALMALDAVVVLLTENGKEECVPVHDFIREKRKKARLILEIRIPYSKRTVCVMSRVARTERDKSIVSVIVRADMTKKKNENFRIAIYGANPIPQRYLQAESAINEETFSLTSIEACVSAIAAETQAVADFRGGAEYRAAMAETLTRRALEALLSKDIAKVGA